MNKIAVLTASALIALMTNGVLAQSGANPQDHEKHHPKGAVAEGQAVTAEKSGGMGSSGMGMMDMPMMKDHMQKMREHMEKMKATKPGSAERGKMMSQQMDMMMDHMNMMMDMMGGCGMQGAKGHN